MRRIPSSIAVSLLAGLAVFDAGPVPMAGPITIAGPVPTLAQAVAPHPPAARAHTADLITRALRASYNLDHDEAAALARQAVALDPNDPAAHRALAAVLWVDILYRRGAITVDAYLGGVTKAMASLPKTPPEIDAEFKGALARAIALAETRLRQSPRDVQAQHDAGSAYALQATYTASVEGSLVAAFGAARRAFDAEEAVLAREPHRARASLIVGTYRYLVSGLALPTRLFAYMAGFGGDKERGIGLIEQARRDPDAHVDATIALILIYTKERRHDDAIRLLRSMAREFPRNRLLVFEEGSALLRAGRQSEAETTLSRGLTEFERDPRRKIPGERALWLYKRAAARTLLNRQADARADITQALAGDPVPWVRGRLHLELGKLADLGGRRTDALAEYRQAKTIGDANHDPAGAAEASRFLRRPFTLGSRRP